MACGAPLAYFLTFTTYGTWLHGDARGSVGRNHNTPGEPGIPPSGRLHAYVRGYRMKSPDVRLEREARETAVFAFEETCSARGWHLLALNVRSNHVHVVIVADKPPEQVLTALKANATRALVERGHFRSGVRLWTRHGSTRYLWTDNDVASASLYTTEFQDGGSGRWDAGR